MPNNEVKIDTVVEEEISTTFPNLYAVKFYNDDFTPMDFVIAVLQEVFGQSDKEAFDITMKVHNEGHAIVGLFSREIAETKARKVTMLAEDYHHPLRVQAVPV